MSEIIATAPVDHWETLLRESRVPVSRVQRMQAMLADEHVRGRPVLHRFHDEAGALAGLAVPVDSFQLSRSPAAVMAPPQAVGA